MKKKIIVIMSQTLVSRLPARSLLVLGAALAVVIGFSATASATHSWNNYHWARQSNPFNLKLSSNLSTDWRPYLQTTSTDWSASSVLDTSVIQGVKNPKTCRATLGQVEVCNARYGQTGWLGLAQIWLSGSHITQGTAKMNDTYFLTAKYNTPEEKNHVMCQEVGHTFGLGHQDETGAALGTCMDYSMSAGSQHPDAHDYAMLEQIYTHLDPTTTVSAATNATQATRDQSDNNNNLNWGRRVFQSQNGRLEVYEKQFRDGSKLVSFVILADHS